MLPVKFRTVKYHRHSTEYEMLLKLNFKNINMYKAYILRTKHHWWKLSKNQINGNSYSDFVLKVKTFLRSHFS